MKTVYHFGDSYGVVPDTENFVKLAANQVGYNYLNQSFGGISTEIIFNLILKSLKDIEPEDLVFINFSFFSRGCWYDEKINKIKSTNQLYSEIHGRRQYTRVSNEHIIALVEYYINHARDYNARLFALINSTLEYLNLKGVKIFYIFVEDSEWSDNLLKTGTNIKFSEGFNRWLVRNNLHLEEEGHYSIGIQPLLANILLFKTDEFKETNKYVFVDSNEATFKELSPKKLTNKVI